MRAFAVLVRKMTSERLHYELRRYKLHAFSPILSESTTAARATSQVVL